MIRTDGLRPLCEVEFGIDLWERPGPFKATTELVRDGEPEKGDKP